MAKEFIAPITAVDAGGFAPATPITSRAQGRKLPNITGHSVPFYLSHNPASWDLAKIGDKNVLLPTLKKIQHAPGVNVVSQGKNDGDMPITTALRTRLEDQGCVTLSVHMDEYQVTIASAKGPAYFLKWERVKTYPDGRFEVIFDKNAYNAWRLELVERGTIEPIRDYVMERMSRRLKRRGMRIEKDVHLPIAKRQLVAQQAQIEQLRQASKGAPNG